MYIHVWYTSTNYTLAWNRDNKKGEGYREGDSFMCKHACISRTQIRVIEKCPEFTPRTKDNVSINSINIHKMCTILYLILNPHICIHNYAHTHTHTHTHTHACIHAQTYTLHTYTHTCADRHTHTRTRTCTDTHTHTERERESQRSLKLSNYRDG